MSGTITTHAEEIKKDNTEEISLQDINPVFTAIPVTQVFEPPEDILEPSFWVKTLETRNITAASPETESQRQTLLQLGQKVIPWEDRLPYHKLPKHGERLGEHLLRLLDDLLVGEPVKGVAGQISYYLNPRKWSRIQEEFQRIQSTVVPLLLKKKKAIPLFPPWGCYDNPQHAWNSLDYEIIAVTFRNDMENALGDLFKWDALAFGCNCV
ncbi:hypothetical protein M422DRAFT_54540 [Sphaerobolus stellatus SS14]|uniref:Uncharacterized protein n=1 Tax=Sphaerobolus stellatus (strain SS14) TaxID=990650 RepID=A0A0C9U318_SPHS4|nr:hypothetical protein M422DRAFT_54540 [Sphaerobolus stellatus SS14]